MERRDEQNENQGRALVRHGSVLSLLTLVSRVLGLLREMAKAALLGTSALSDAFSVAFMIPNLFRRLFAEGSIAVAFIPVFKEYLLENEGSNQESIKDFLSCVLTFLTFFVTLTVMAGIALCPFIIRLFGMKEEFNEAVFLTRLMFPFLGFISIAAFFQGILNSLNVFAPSGFAPIVLNIVTIICAYTLKDYTGNPARAMAVGILGGGFLEAAIQLPFVLKHKKRLRFFFTGIKKAINNPGTRKVLRLIGPTIIGMAAYQINDLVSTALAGNAGEGVVSSLQYSLRLQELILGIFAVSIGTVLLPELTECAKSGRWETYNARLSSAINIIAFITIPITVFSFANGDLLIRAIFQARSFDDESVRLTLSAFSFHIPGLFFIALNRILAPAFYAQSDTKSPTLAGIISFGMNIILAALLVGRFEGAGIAFALSFAGAVNTVLLFVFLKKNPAIILGRTLTTTLAYCVKLILFSGIALIPVLFLSPHLSALFAERGRILSHAVPLAVNALIFALAGILLLFVTGDRQLLSLFGKIKARAKV
ncbi:MAG: murein biosynthesis integral membrane protein MurJ [Treponema sp.]|jgi:putative peptidoglycan lipid II flippase|nr:murein biosynthesis integral membrane protein MurJ [Treponema sp.]